MSFVNPRALLLNGCVFVDDGKPKIDEKLQLQPSGIDLRIDYFTQIVGGGYLGVKQKQNSMEVKLEPHLDIYKLELGIPYMAYFVESCKLPIHMSALIWGRSTLVRNGILCLSMVYDPGYENVVACPVYPFRGFAVERYARFAQFCGVDNFGTIIYEGSYTRKVGNEDK